jgi:hypothetical protein
MINSNACFAYFNKIRGILRVFGTPSLVDCAMNPLKHPPGPPMTLGNTARAWRVTMPW